MFSHKLHLSPLQFLLTVYHIFFAFLIGIIKLHRSSLFVCLFLNSVCVLAFIVCLFFVLVLIYCYGQKNFIITRFFICRSLFSYSRNSACFRNRQRACCTSDRPILYTNRNRRFCLYRSIWQKVLKSTFSKYK